MQQDFFTQNNLGDNPDKKKFTLSTLIQDPNIVQNPGVNVEANLVYSGDNLFISQLPSYNFTGTLVSNNLMKLQNTDGIADFILNFNSSNASDSKITFENSVLDEGTLYSNTVENIFNKTDKNIYFDMFNAIVYSNDLDGNIIYLTLLVVDYPVDWNYDLDNATKFNIKYI